MPEVYTVKVEEARPAAHDKPSAGPVYRCIYAKDGLLELPPRFESPWDFFRSLWSFSYFIFHQMEHHSMFKCGCGWSKEVEVFQYFVYWWSPLLSISDYFGCFLVLWIYLFLCFFSVIWFWYGLLPFCYWSIPVLIKKNSMFKCFIILPHKKKVL